MGKRVDDMKQLLMGSWLGELGWECCVWVPIMRCYAHKYKFGEVIVVCQKGHEYLYKDFATKFENHNKSGDPDRWLLNGKKVQMPEEFIKKYEGAELRRPRKKKCMTWKKEFFKYGQADPDLIYDIVIHARAETKYGQAKRNWRVKNYVQLLKDFPGLKVCSIGTKAHHIPGTEDKRNISLEQLCNLFASSRLTIGSSSGPLHLSMLCDCPVLVWTTNNFQKSVRGTNKERYSKFWNPFKTSCTVLDEYGWNCPVSEVSKALKEYL